jgi:alanine dehydrogenase
LTVDEVRQVLQIEDVLSLVEKAFEEKGLKRVQMPPKSYLFFEKYDGDLRIMPSYLEKLDEPGVKVVNVHPGNPEKYGLPAIMATILLFDPHTGAPVSIMDGTLITAMRTAAATSIATRFLARKNSKILGMVGAGYQAPFQLEALRRILNLEMIKVYGKHKNKAEKLSKQMGTKLGVEIRAVNRIEDAVKGVDILVTITPSRSPIVKNEWVDEGMHINAVGADAPGKQELDPRILKRAKIIVDDWEQASHGGEINVPFEEGMIIKEDIYAELGEIVAGLKSGRLYDEEITVFDSTGLSIQDTITSWHVYKLAKEKGLGKEISLTF